MCLVVIPSQINITKRDGVFNPVPNVSVMSKLSSYMSNALRFGRSNMPRPALGNPLLPNFRWEAKK